MSVQGLSLAAPGNGKHVLVSGGTGYVATQVISDLVDLGYKVTATTRSATRAQPLYTTFPKYVNTVKFISVPDFTVPGAFDGAFKAAVEPFSYVLHTASPIPLQTTDVKKDLIDPAIEGTLGMLKAAKEFGGDSLKRIVITGSGVSMIDPFRAKDDPRAEPLTEKDWNPVTIETAVSTQNVGLGYFASKTYAEKAAWEFIATEKPSYDISIIMPVIVLGPALTKVSGPEAVEQGTNTHIYNFFNGTNKSVKGTEFMFYDEIDVRDVSLAHILALTTPAASNERIVLSNPEPLTPQSIVNILNKNFPELKDRIATSGDVKEANYEGAIYPEGVKPTRILAAKAEKVFGSEWKWTSLETTVVDFVREILEEEKVWKQ